MDKQKRTAILLWGFTILLLAVIALLLWRTGFFQAIASEDTLAAYIQAFTPWSHLMYFAVQLFSVILAPIPSNITAAVGGLLFGTLPAFLLTWGAVVLGSLVVFALARSLGQRFVEGLVSRKVSEKYLDLVRRKRDVFLLLAFLFPFFPDDILCILAGLTDISCKRFLVLCLVARPWGLLVACAFGGSALDIPIWAMAVIGLAGIALFLLGMKYGDKMEQAILDRLKK